MTPRAPGRADGGVSHADEDADGVVSSAAVAGVRLVGGGTDGDMSSAAADQLQRLGSADGDALMDARCAAQLDWTAQWSVAHVGTSLRLCGWCVEYSSQQDVVFAEAVHSRSFSCSSSPNPRGSCFIVCHNYVRLSDMVIIGTPSFLHERSVPLLQR